MKYSKSNYPVGSRWECINEVGKIGYITLHQRLDTFEVWYYGYYYPDGSGHKFDWTTSYRSAKNNHWLYGKFERVK